MYTSTDAVILHVTPYGDKSLIVNLYTESGGRMDCFMSRSSGKRSPISSALLQPLNLVTVQIKSKPVQNMGTIVSVSPKYIVTHDDMTRQCLRMYIAELLYRTLRQPLAEPNLFNHIEDTVYCIDKESHIANVHLHFMLRLSDFLGFAPNMESDGAYFDLESGTLTIIKPSHPNYLGEKQTSLVKRLITDDYKQVAEINMSRDERQQLIRNIEYYYQLHISDFSGMKSTDTLLQLFD